MAASGEEIRGSGGSKEEQVEVAGGTFHSEASGTGVGTVSPHSDEACASTHASPAQELIDALNKIQEEIPDMGREEVRALTARLRAFRLLVVQRIKEEQEEKAAAAEQATAPEPRRAG